jgi:hypothetical protein
MPEFGEDVRAVAIHGLGADDQQSAISLVELPSAISLTISSSRGVRTRSGTLSRLRWSRISAVTAAG